MKYTNLDAVIEYLGKDVDATQHTRIERWIEAMSRLVDKETNHNPLVCDATKNEVSYFYDGSGESSMFVDDIQKDKIEYVKVGGSAITDFDIQSNYGDGGYLLHSDSGFPRGERNVEVKGKFGKFLTIPDDIQLATTILTGLILNNSMNEHQEVRSETIGRYSISFGSKRDENDFELAKSILANHRKITIL